MTKRLWFSLYVIAALLLVSAACIWLFAPRHLRNESFVLEGKPELSTGMPKFLPMEQNQKFTATLRLGAMPKVLPQLWVFPDDCLDSLKIDGAAFPLQGVDPCNTDFGFGLQLPAAQVDRELIFYAHNNQGVGGIKVMLQNDSGLRHWAMKLFIVGSLFLLLGFIMQRRWQWYLQPVALLGFAMRFWYWSFTPCNVREHDLHGHISYIVILLRNWLPPNNNECWQCYQPPLYYYPAALFHRIVDVLCPELPVFWEVQLLSFLASFGFMLAGLSLLRRFKGSDFLVFTLALVFALWPAPIVHSPRIGNDTFVYLFSALALRSLWLWSESGNGRKHALWASVFAGFALASKASGFAVYLTVVLCLLLSIRSRRELLTAAYASALWVAAFVSAFAGPIIRYVHGAQYLIPSNVDGLPDTLRVAAEPGNFLWFDVKTWVMYPFTDAFNDTMGRTWFFNYAGKTALFGEFHLAQGPLGYWLASIICVSALVLIVLALRGLLRMQRSDLPWALALALFVLALAEMRFMHPFACSNDARYVLPAIIPFMIFVGRGLEQPFASKALQHTIWLAVFAFPLASFALLISMVPI